MANLHYPTGPSDVPKDFTIPGPSFKKHIWIASITLLLFIALYFLLTGTFFYTSYRLFRSINHGAKSPVLSFFVALAMAFLGIFMIKALFFFKRRNKTGYVEITKEQEPELFEFIYMIAEDAKAPRPKRVYLSNTVNAAVFYDLSVLNLIFPSRKNLEIGLGLVNILNLGEFKAVLAHEFGHFAQKSMIIGRWVYIANQVANQIIVKRDALDNILGAISHFDLRVAWIGWILSIIVWAIRSVAETFFKLVVITQRALSREMEFHADLVAVSLTGSDALMNALHRLSPADEAFDSAIGFSETMLNRKMKVSDVYALQANALMQTAKIMNNPQYGASPKIPSANPANFRVFNELLTQPPKMWATHPSNVDRENNAKKRYISADIDERSAWVVFKNPTDLKIKLTAELFKEIKTDATMLSAEESIEKQNKQYEHVFFHSRYRGVYLDRFIFNAYESVDAVYGVHLLGKDYAEQFSQLYPETLNDQLEQLKMLDEELALLTAIKNSVLKEDSGTVKHRGRELKKKELPAVIAQIKEEAKPVREKIREHDKLCRTVHYYAAKQINNGWDEYLKSLAVLIHYCEHTHSNLVDRLNVFRNELRVASAARKVTPALLTAAGHLFSDLQNIFLKSRHVKLNDNLIQKFGGKDLDGTLGNFKMVPANDHNINAWIGAIDSWVNLALNSISELRIVALDELLRSEEYVEEVIRNRSLAINTAPAPVSVDLKYDLLIPGTERPINNNLDLWDRFQIADGVVPTIARLAVASSIIIGGIMFGTGIGSSSVVIYNGLDRRVVVRINGQSIELGEHRHFEMDIGNSKSLLIETKTADGQFIESFQPEMTETSGTYIYNVAGYAVIYEWTAVYGTRTFIYGNEYTGTQKILGAKRWLASTADYYFEDPPESVSVSQNSSVTKFVVSADDLKVPQQIVPLLKDEEEINNLVLAHCLWEYHHSPTILVWFNYASSLKNFPSVLQQRLQRLPDETVSLRMQQDLFEGNKKEELCTRIKKLSEKYSADADYYYLSCRCLPDNAEQDSLFARGNRKWPGNAWLAYAAGHNNIRAEEWQKALINFDTVYQNEPALKDALGDYLERIGRLMNTTDSVLPPVHFESPYLDYVKQIEKSTSDNTYNTLFAFKLLNAGKLQEAVAFADTAGGFKYEIMRLAAASKNASQGLIDTALSLGEKKGMNDYTLIATVALCAKRNAPFEKYKEQLDGVQPGYADSLSRFIQLAKAGNTKEADKLLKQMVPVLKGLTALVGVMLLENKAPEKWINYESKLLFINEKPYMGDLKIHFSKRKE